VHGYIICVNYQIGFHGVELVCVNYQIGFHGVELVFIQGYIAYCLGIYTLLFYRTSKLNFHYSMYNVFPMGML